MSVASSPRGVFREAVSAITHVGPSIAYVAYVFWGGSVNETGEPLPISDKVLHAAAFGVMVPLVLLAVTYVRPAAPFSSRVLLSATLASTAGALLEFWQFFLPWRSCDVFDWLADTVGAVIVASVVLGVQLLVRRTVPSRA